MGLPVALEVPERGAALHWIGLPGRAMLGLWTMGSAPLGMRLHVAFDMALADVLAAPEALRNRGIEPLSFFGEPTDEPSVIGMDACGGRLRPRVEQHSGSRADLRSLFELAEDSPSQLDSYLEGGRVLVAIQGDKVIRHLQLTETDLASEVEIRAWRSSPPAAAESAGR